MAEDTCPGCGGRLEHEGVRVVYATDIPPIPRPQVTGYRVTRRTPMTTTTELTPLLKRLKLGAVLNTLPERVALARREQLGYASFLQII